MIVKALPWHTNAPRDGRWWVGLEGQAGAEHDAGANWVVTDLPGRRYSGVTHAEAVEALEKHIADAQEALEALKGTKERGEFSE